MNQTQSTSSEAQLILKVHNLYKAETDKRIADLQQLIDIRDQEINRLKQDNADLRETVREKDARIDHLTNVICDIPEPAKCKVVSLRPAYAQ